MTDEVQVLDVRRIRRRAVEDRELLVRGEDRLDRAVDVLERPAARREQHRPAERSHVPQERHVQEIPRCELERVDAELREELGARLVERRSDERGAFLARVPAQLEPVALRELERLPVRAVRRPEAVLVVVGRVVERAREEAPVVAFLELHCIGPALARRVDERLRLLEVALVVVPDLSDDVRGPVPRDDPPVDDQLAHGPMVRAKPELERRLGRPTS